MSDKKPFVLPADIRRKRIFWLLSLFFVFLVSLGMLLLVLLLNMVQPPGFGAAPFSPVVNFQTSFYGPAGELLDRPSAVALSPSGEVYVSDTGNARVVVFDREGNTLRSITELIPAPVGVSDPELSENIQDEMQSAVQEITAQDGSAPSGYIPGVSDYRSLMEDAAPETFVAPTSLAFASDGRWFAVDQAQRIVLFFDAEDRLLQGLRLEEEEPISLSTNLVDGSERLFITTRSGILQGSLEGDFFHAYFNWGLLSGQLDNPASVVVFDPALMSEEASISTTDTASLTIVADTLNNRIQAFRNFDTEPEIAWIYGRPLIAPGLMAGLDYEFEHMIPGYMSAPVDMALSPLARLFVVDGLSSEIVVLNAQTGAYEYTISSIGSRDGFLYFPSGVEYAQGNIYVVDRFNDRLSIFEDASPVIEDVAVYPSEALNRWLLLVVPAAAFLLALARLMTLRMPRYILDLDALEHLAEDDQLLMFIIEHFDNLSIVPGTETLAEEMLPGYDWKVELAKEEKRDKLIDKYPGLSDFDAEALAVALKRKRGSYLLTASAAAQRAGSEEGAQVVPFAEFRSIAQGIIAEEALVDQEDQEVDKEANQEAEEAQ